MMKATLFFSRLLALGTVLTLLGASGAQANTPRGSAGITTGSEIAPIHLRTGGDRGIGRDRLGMEVIGELRAIISEPAIPPREEGIEFERQGFYRIDLKRSGSTPVRIAERFSRYVDYLNSRAGEYTVFGSDRAGTSRNIRVVLKPLLNRTVKVEFTSDLRASGNPDGKPTTVTFLAPNPKVAAVLAGVLTALDASSASASTIKMASEIVLSLGNIQLTSLEIQQLSQALTETLLAGEGTFAGCGRDIAAENCNEVNRAALGMAIRAYNQVVRRSNVAALKALEKNPEFQTLGERLRRARGTLQGRS